MQSLFMAALMILTPSAPGPAEQAAPEAQFKPLFDGRSLNGWEGNLEAFRVQDGAIVGGRLDRPMPRNEYLCTKKEYANFELRFNCRLIGKDVNGGVQIRSQRIANNNNILGYQADMADKFWGNLYDERRHKLLAGPSKAEQDRIVHTDGCNDYRVLCEGRRVRFWLNGQLTVDYTGSDAAREQVGIIGVQIHVGGPGEAWYKDLRIRELPATP